MRFQAVHIRDFRNLESVTFQPDRGLNVIEGSNGQGKTSLLEALHLTTSLRSFRGHPTRDLIRIGQDKSGILVRFEDEHITRDVEIQLAGSRRSLKVNGDRVKQLSEYFGHVRVVTFIPDDVIIFRASPAERRLFFDRIIFSLTPSYAEESACFEETLKQRNGLLRHEQPDLALLDIYDEQLAQSAAKIVARRQAFVEKMEAPLRLAFHEVFGSDFLVALTYESECEDAPQILANLRRRRGHDIQRGHTTFGPHRDDFLASLDGQPFKNYASQGQHRALVLACKITEMRLAKESGGQWPVLLMDDVSSELDPIRNQQLFSFLAELDTQVFLTTTNRSTLQLPENYTLWQVDAGTLSRANTHE